MIRQRWKECDRIAAPRPYPEVRGILWYEVRLEYRVRIAKTDFFLCEDYEPAAVIDSVKLDTGCPFVTVPASYAQGAFGITSDEIEAALSQNELRGEVGKLNAIVVSFSSPGTDAKRIGLLIPGGAVEIFTDETCLFFRDLHVLVLRDPGRYLLGMNFFRQVDTRFTGRAKEAYIARPRRQA